MGFCIVGRSELLGGHNFMPHRPKAINRLLCTWFFLVVSSSSAITSCLTTAMFLHTLCRPIPHVRSTAREDYNGATYSPLPTTVQSPITSGTSACTCILYATASQQTNKPAQAVRMAPSCDNFRLVYFRVWLLILKNVDWFCATYFDSPQAWLLLCNILCCL